jgi:hypothetical protein
VAPDLPSEGEVTSWTAPQDGDPAAFYVVEAFPPGP